MGRHRPCLAFTSALAASNARPNVPRMRNLQPRGISECWVDGSARLAVVIQAAANYEHIRHLVSSGAIFGCQLDAVFSGIRVESEGSQSFAP